jgi:RNA recognition motif-containing protein
MKNRRIVDYSSRLASVNVYVGNLSLTTTEAQLRQEFVPFGQVASVTMMDDKYIGSRQPRGYGFVEMPVRAEAEAAIAQLNGKTMQNHVVNVIEAMSLSPIQSTTPVHARYRQRS